MEDHFKEKLKNHKVDWDKEVLLEGLQKELSQKNDRFRWKWILLLPLLLIATCWGWNYDMEAPEKYSLKSNSTDTNLSLEKEEKSIPSTIEKDTNQTSAHKESGSITQPNKTTPQTTQSISSTNLSENTSQELQNNNTISRPGRSNQPSLTPSLYPNLKTTLVEYPIKTDKIKSEIQNNIPDELASQQKLTTVLTNTLQTREATLPVGYLTTLTTQELPISSRLLNLKFNKSEEVVLNENYGNTDNGLYMSASSELGVVRRNVKFGDIDNINPLVVNEKTERSLFIASANLKLGYQHKSGLSVQSGIELNKIVEVFNIRDSIEGEIVPKEKLRYIIVENRDTTFIMDTVNVFRTGTRRVRHYNTHTFYTIPFEIGYNLNLKKAKLFSRIGMSFTFSHNYKGRFNYPIEEGLEIVESNPEINYDLTSRIGYQLGLGLEYPILKRSNFYVNATYRRSPNMRLHAKTQNYNSLSLGAGIRIPLW